MQTCSFKEAPEWWKHRWHVSCVALTITKCFSNSAVSKEKEFVIMIMQSKPSIKCVSFYHLPSVRLKIHSKHTLLAESHIDFSHWSKQLTAPDTEIPFLELLIIQSVLLEAHSCDRQPWVVNDLHSLWKVKQLKDWNLTSDCPELQKPCSENNLIALTLIFQSSINAQKIQLSPGTSFL